MFFRVQVGHEVDSGAVLEGLKGLCLLLKCKGLNNENRVLGYIIL